MIKARLALAALAAALAAAPLAAQKPGEGDKTDPQSRWREQGIALCVGELRSIEGMTPEDLETICGCAFERLPPGRTDGAAPELGEGRLAPAVGGQILSCTARQRPELAAAVSRWLVQRPPASTPAPMPPPAAEPAPAASDKPDERGADFDLRAWWDGLILPDWLDGVPRWAWIPIGLLVLLLLGGLFRRREGGRDLMGPPPHMRSTVRFGPRSGPPPVR